MAVHHSTGHAQRKFVETLKVKQQLLRGMTLRPSQ